MKKAKFPHPRFTNVLKNFTVILTISLSLFISLSNSEHHHLDSEDEDHISPHDLESDPSIMASIKNSVLNSHHSSRLYSSHRGHDEDEHEMGQMFPNHHSSESDIIGIGTPGMSSGLVNHDLILDSGHTGIGAHVLPQGLCEPIKIGLCMDLGYNQTTMPNLVGHDVQVDADALLQTFTPLIQYGCSPHLKLFLCASHAPMCTDKVPQPIGPCRSLCESVRRKCEPVLIEFGFKWPPNLECAKFYPENNHQHMCIPGPMDQSHSSLPGKIPAGFGIQISKDVNPKLFGLSPPSENGKGKIEIPIRFNPSNFDKTVNKHTGSIESILFDNGNKKQGNVPNLAESKCISSQKFWIKDHCWTKCETISSEPGHYFQPNEKAFARNYALPWALLSLVSASLAIIFAFYSPRVNVAERPIIYIALCQVLFSIGIIIGTTVSVTCFTDKTTGIELQAGKGMIPSSCAVVFLLTYFFGMAGTIWWVILCLSWTLSLNPSLCLTLTQRESSIFHLLSWGLASVLTSTALLHKKVDADFIFGLCGVGYQDMDALINYNMIPLVLCLCLGLLFLFGGLICRLKIIPTSCGFNKIKRGSNMQQSNHSPNHGARHNHAYSPVQPPQHSNSVHLHHHHNSCPCCSPHCTTITTTTTTSSSSANFFYNNQNQSHPSNNSRLVNTNGIGNQHNRAMENSKQVWIRIGIFALVHAIPVACQVATIAYEVGNRGDWELEKISPSLQLFLLKLNMDLIPGLTTGVWVLSTYSWKTFSSLSQYLCCLKQWNLFKLFRSTKSKKLRTVLGDGTSVMTCSTTNTNTTSPLLVPVPVNSTTTSYITLNGSSNNNRQTFAGIAPMRCHSNSQHLTTSTSVPLVPPLPARNPPTTDQPLGNWRRTETIL